MGTTDDGIQIAGTLLADVEVEDSAASPIVAGAIGSATVRPSIQIGGGVNNQSGITAESINADITINGDITRPISVTDGDFTGSLHAPNLTGTGISIDGDLDADLVFTGSISAPITIEGELLEGRTITAGGSLDTGSTIEIGADAGLEGQIILNANDCASSGCEWAGDVVVGTTSPITLSQADYTTLSSQLGGGAVGLVPFNMHGLASSPPYDGTPVVKLVSDFNHTTTDPSDHFDVEIEHYGPVEVTGPEPIILEAYSDGVWGGLPADLLITVQTFYDDSTLNARTIRIKSNGDKMRNLVRFRPGPDLVCAGVAGSPPVFPWEYQLKLLADCDSDGVADSPDGPDTDTSSCGSGLQCCDLDGTPGVNVFDLLFYLDCWFAETSCAEWTSDDPPSIDVYDLLAYLDCWFSTNPCH